MSVVVGVDGSAGSVRALKWAAEEAKARKTVLKVVFAWSFLDQPQGTFDPNYGEEQARARLEEILASHAADLDGVDVERLVVNDLHRCVPAYYGIRLIGPLLSRSPMFRHDGPLSVLRGFHRSELREIAETAGLKDYTLRWHWAFRWCLSTL